LDGYEMKGTIAVISVDPGFFDRVKQHLHRSGYSVAGFASEQDACSHALASDCVLFSVAGKLSGGFDYLRRMKSSAPVTPVILAAREADLDLVLLAGQLGAVDFLLEPLEKKRLLKAVGVAMQQAFDHAEAIHERASLQARYSNLTERQRETMYLLLQGMGKRDIALQFSISVRTVEIYRAAVMARMNASSLVQLVRMGIRLGLD
jgi:two-component system, LuxR family, response regulator FixJ